MSTDEAADRQLIEDIKRMSGILQSAPAGGLSLEEIQKVTEDGEKLSFRTINDVLCQMGNRVKFEKVRVNQRRVTKYTLRSW